MEIMYTYRGEFKTSTNKFIRMTVPMIVVLKDVWYETSQLRKICYTLFLYCIINNTKQLKIDTDKEYNKIVEYMYTNKGVVVQSLFEQYDISGYKKPKETVDQFRLQLFVFVKFIAHLFWTRASNKLNNEEIVILIAILHSFIKNIDTKKQDSSCITTEVEELTYTFCINLKEELNECIKTNTNFKILK